MEHTSSVYSSLSNFYASFDKYESTGIIAHLKPSFANLADTFKSMAISTRNVSQILTNFEKNPYWDDIAIDPKLNLGVSTSAYQLDGATNFPNSTWAHFENSFKKNRSPCIENGDKSGIGLNYWNHPEKLIAKLKGLGVQHYRFSIEWSAICPQKDVIDHDALQKYKNLVKLLKENGIEPNITLHHFSEPKWFLDEGGFENEENIKHILEFCKLIYSELSSEVKEWVTFNEPAIYAFQGYYRGDFPPGVQDRRRCGIVLKNMLMAHSEIYDALKKIDDSTKIGIAHQALRFRPKNPENFIAKKVCSNLTHMTHDAVMKFFKTGKFEFTLPFSSINYSKPDIQDKFDFLGIQYYSDPLIGKGSSEEFMESTCYPHEKMTDMPFRFYPEGLASLLNECRAIKKPVWITETGAATNEADQKEYIEKALKVASLAKELGVDVEKVYIWSLIDNFEWNMGWAKRFGLYSFDHKTGETKLKSAGEFFRELINASINDV